MGVIRGIRHLTTFWGHAATLQSAPDADKSRYAAGHVKFKKMLRDNKPGPLPLFRHYSTKRD